MEQKTFYILTYHELDKLIADTYKVSGYECVAEEEWNNDSSYTFNSVNGSLKEYEGDRVSKWLNGTGRPMYCTGIFLSMLVRDNVLPFGNYLVTVCW